MRTFFASLIAVLLASPAHAALFTWQIEGAITGLHNPGFGGPYSSSFAVDQSFLWSLTLEDTAMDFDAHPACGLYRPIRAMSFISGDVSLSRSTTPGQDFMLNAGGPCTPPFVNYARIRSDFGTSLFFVLHFWSIFATDALPTEPNMTQFGTLSLIYGDLHRGRPIASARVTSMNRTITEELESLSFNDAEALAFDDDEAINVPEPTRLFLFGLGLLVFAKRMQRRLHAGEIRQIPMLIVLSSHAANEVLR